MMKKSENRREIGVKVCEVEAESAGKELHGEGGVQ